MHVIFSSVCRCWSMFSDSRSRVTFGFELNLGHIRLRVARYRRGRPSLSRAIHRAERERLSSFLGSLLPVTFSSPPLSGLALVWLLLYPVVRSVSVCCCCRRARSLSLSLSASSLANFVFSSAGSLLPLTFSSPLKPLLPSKFIVGDSTLCSP